MLKRLQPVALALVVGAVLGASATGFAAAKPPRCPLGSVRGMAFVTGDPSQGIANLPGDWSSADKLFGFRYSCSGGGAQVKKSQHTNGGFDIRFPGNPGRFAVANVADDGTKAISVVPEPDGSFHVTEAGNAPGETFPFRSDASFFIVLY